MSDDYRPIDCAVYSEYELAILHRQPLRVHWRDEEGRDRLATLVPLDLKTAPTKEEFLFARDQEGQEVKIRLDRIVTTEPITSGESP